MEFNFEFTDEELKIIERLVGCDYLLSKTKEDIISFINTYKFKQKLYQTEKKYAKITVTKEDNSKNVFLLYVDEIIEEDKRIRLRSTQTICYTYIYI